MESSYPTACGSSRAELQHWTVDLETKTATLEKFGHRQLSPMQPRLDVEPLIVALMNNDLRDAVCGDGDA